MPHTDLEHAAATLRAGGLVLAVDRAALGGAGRGFFLHAAALATPEVVNTAILHGRGLTCFSVSPAQAMRLGLRLADELHGAHHGPLFLRSVEAANCEGTGISAEDRAATLRAAGSPDAGMASLKSPGHVFPAMTTEQASAEADVATLAAALLQKLTGHDVAAWIDILDDAGEVATTQWCETLAETAQIPLIDAHAALVG